MGEVDAETELAWQLATLGEVQRQYRYAVGRQFRADFAFVAERLLVQVDGGVYSRQAHGSISGVLADIARANAAALNGWLVVRVLPEWCAHKDGSAFRAVERVLKAIRAEEGIK